MSSSQEYINTSGIAPQGDVAARDITMTMYTTTNYITAATPNFREAERSGLWNPFCTVDAPVPNFSGRGDLIVTIHRQMEQCSKERECFKKIVVIHGLGGMGKSELVRKYVEEYQKDPIIINAAWIDAQNKNSLERGFKSLAEELHLQTKDKDVKDVVYSVYKHLSDHNQPSLFIFDNAEQMRSDTKGFGILDFLPTVQLKTIPLIIITTRVNNWEIREENVKQINELSEDAGTEFLTKRFKLSEEQKSDKDIMDALKNLAQNLQCFPLALTLAASNIKISKLRKIPTEIEAYIQKLKGPHGDWITEGHSSGTFDKYDLTMNNVWATTLDKINSQGDDGEAAISILNIIAYLPPDEITVEHVANVAEFSGIKNSTSGIEMLELYSLISLPLLTKNDNYRTNEYPQRIRIHRLVQRCTRDKLDREKNYDYLLNISMYLSQERTIYLNSQYTNIQEHLEERMRLRNSITSSILFASQIYEFSDKYKIVKDIHEVLTLDEKPGYVQNLEEDYKILHAVNLFWVSTHSYKYKKLCKDLISKDPSYSNKNLEQAFVSGMAKCVKCLFTGTLHTENLVNKAIIRVIIQTIPDSHSLRPTLCQEFAEKIPLMLADATGNSFEGSVETVGKLYSLLWNICRYSKRIAGGWYVETVNKIHGSVYASIQELGERRLESYWKDDRPIHYKGIVNALNDFGSYAVWKSGRRNILFLHFILISNPAAAGYSHSTNIIERVIIYYVAVFKDFIASFCTEAGLQFLRQHLEHVDALTKTKMDHLPFNAACLFEFIKFLGKKWNCTKKFVQANLFMETLHRVTKNLLELHASRSKIHDDQFLCLMVWFELFGRNSFVDRNGVKWSIESVENEMSLFLDALNRSNWRLSAHVAFYRKATYMLNKFIKSSGSDQESIAVKTATRNLESLIEFLSTSRSSSESSLNSFLNSL